MYKGTGASPGIALGKALVIEHSEMNIEKRTVENVEVEVEKLQAAVEKSRVELEEVKEKAKIELGEHEAEIFEAHLLVLADPELIDQTISKIRDEKLNADFALNEVKEMFVAIFESMDNEYMRERAADIKDVTNRVLRHILGIKVVDLSALAEEVILIAHDLTPSDTATMNKKMVLGFLTDIGGRTSHTAIMARTLEIAAVVGLNDATEKINDGDFIVFNGDTGEVIVNPDEETIANYRALKAKYDEEKEALKQLIGQTSVTTDGRHVELAGNIGSPNDVEGLIKNDAEGVGLYRTEFLYMDKEDAFPTEEEQYEAYKAVLEGMNGKPIVIRTLDIGGDKELPYFKMDEEMNPFLGYRAIRLCLDRTDIFKTQLRALYRASVHGKLRIMFPMISSLEELLAAKEVIKEVLAEMDAQGL
ncbi:MAG: phosphoenolpyruvate--protein phosphotransferase, partial [Paraclostridium sp.]